VESDDLIFFTAVILPEIRGHGKGWSPW